ncbi:MAG: WD40 repeat domain-containing protein [Armatimonadota bacterium]
MLKKGEAISNQAIFFNTDSAENADFDLRRLNQDACMITENREPLGFFFTAPGSIDLPAQLATDAPMGYLSEDAIALCDASRAGAISADVPVDMQIDFRTQALHVMADGQAAITVGDITQTIEGEGDIDLGEMADTIRRAWHPAFDKLAGRCTSARPGGGVGGTIENMARAWSVEGIEHDGEMQKTLEVKATDVDGDGAEEQLAIRGRFLSCIDSDGTLMWEFDGNDELYSLSAYDTNGDGTQEIFVGGKDRHLYMLSAVGELLHDHEIQTYLRSTRTTIHEPRLDDVLVRDYDGDGDWEAGLGTVDGFTQMIDHNFEQQWIFGETNHGTTEFQALDCNHDGVLDLVVGNRYGKMYVFDIKTGDPIAFVRSELGDCQIEAADIDGDDSVELINGSATGAFVCEDFDKNKTDWLFPNYGYRVRDIKTADFTGDEKLEVAIASDTEYVYIVSATGEQLSQRNLHSAVLDLAVVPTDEGNLLAAGCLDGMVYLLDGSLEIIGQFPLAFQVNWVEAAGDGAAIVAGTEDGRVVKLRIK